MMKQHIKLHDIVEANSLLIAMGGQDQLPAIASAAIERSLELQHRVDRAIRYAEEAHSSSLHVKQVLRILDGSITLDDEMNEMTPEPVPQTHSLDDYPRLVRQPLEAAAHMDKFPRDGSSGLTGRSTEQRKAFRDWLSTQGIELPLNQPVPKPLVDQFDAATEGRYVPKRSHHKKPPSSTGSRGKLRPGHGLEGRSDKERLHIRAWLAEQGFDINPTGRIPQKLIDHYDAAQAELKRMERERRQQPQQEQEQHAQGA